MNSSFKYPKDMDVYWEKWIDAYHQELEQEEEIIKQLEEIEDLGYDIDPEVMEQLDAFSSLPSIKTVMTPFGMMPLTEQSLASSHFKFWVGHTNFKLLKSYTRLIGSQEGVEAIDILTPYRFRIAIGKLFVDRDVMSTVRNSLLREVKDG